MLTAKVMAVAFFAGYLVGVPLIWLARRGKPLTASDWLYAPFVGLSAATLFTHQLAYLDVRIVWSAPALWVAILVLWLWLGFWYGWSTPFRNCPWPVLLAALAVYLVHGLGLLINGPDQYVGRYHTDRFNYISVAHYLIDVPFSTGWEGIGQRAYLADAVKLKMDRVGAMALQGFLAVSAGESADRTFEATMLLGPALMVPALMLVGLLLGFPRGSALLAATAGGLLPALTALHTLCFFANVVSLPFLVASVAALAGAIFEPSGRRAVLAALICAGTLSLYTEFTVLVCAIGGGLAVFGFAFGACGGRHALGVPVVVLVLSFAVYPKSPATDQIGAVTRVANESPKENPVAWIQGEPTFGAVWVCDVWSVEGPDSRRRIVTAIGLGFTALAALGLLRLALGALVRFRADGERDATRARVRAVGLVVVCLALGPLVLFADGKHNYQAMKMVLSLAPFWVLGLAAALRPWRWSPDTVPQSGAPFLWGRAAFAGLLLPVFVCGYGTAALEYKLTKNAPARMSHHQVALNPHLNELKAALRKLRNEDIVLAVGAGMVGNGELSLAARRNRVWLTCPQINDRHALGCLNPDPSLRPFANGRHLVDLTTVPATALVVTLNTPNALLQIEGEKTLLKRIGSYDIWRVGPGPYELIATEHAQRPPELDHPSPPKKKP